MKYSDFEKRPYIKDTLVSDGYILTGAELIGSLTLSESVNVGEDLNFGSCIISTIELELSNMNETIDDLTGREFIWKQAVKTGAKPYQKLIRAAGSVLACVNGAAAYIVSAKPPYLSIWDTEKAVRIKDADHQPAKPVKGLAVVGNKLYCFHDEPPYITAYDVRGQDLAETAAPALNSFETGKIQYLCARIHHYSCNVQGNLLKEYFVDLYDQKPDILIETTFEYVQMGVYIAEKPTKVNDTRIKVRCSDRLSKFDRYVDDWMNSVTYPITLKDYLRSLCALVGVPFTDSQFINQDYVIRKNYRGQNVTGLQALRWIAQAAVSFGRMDERGNLTLGWYRPIDYEINSSVYETAQIEEYETKKIEKLQIRVIENDIGVIVPADDPAKTNTYVIENNPLLYAETDAELRPAATRIFNAIQNITYQPYRVKISRNALLKAGDILTLTTPSGKTFPAYIMARSMKGQMDELSAVGNRVRATQSDAVNQQIQQLRGTVHQFTVDLTTLSSTITNYQAATEEELKKLNSGIGDINDALIVQESSITQLAGSISTKVSQTVYDQEKKVINEHFSSLDQTVDGFKLAVDNHKLTFDKNGLTVYNGGFRVNNGKKDVLSVTTSGDLLLSGIFVSENGGIETMLSDGSIHFRKGGIYQGSIGASGWEANGITLSITGKVDALDAFQVSADMLHVAKELFYPMGFTINGTKWYLLAHL